MSLQRRSEQACLAKEDLGPTNPAHVLTCVTITILVYFHLRFLLCSKKAGMQLHNGGLLVTAAPVSLHQLMPHFSNLQHDLVISQSLVQFAMTWFCLTFRS